eukprot:CAMPEP_0174728858 /NCGR_PEP_ID=MMETSP1094-20130205/52552_1 /TAXON_ID=156173 /ORGANISM="Chrysochromulina brevifilum, Strain UTEX LB 985" /LENGTH=64 /DNA_ID=CAMNT_0015930859 /DNA_START=193 /DNA_END=383 /DNA_ORIENTATION=-
MTGVEAHADDNAAVRAHGPHTDSDCGEVDSYHQHHLGYIFLRMPALLPAFRLANTAAGAAASAA